MKILIVGYGYVGKAVHHGFNINNNIVRFYDPKYVQSSLNDSLNDDSSYDVAFVCVPTPTIDNICDTSVVMSVIKDLKRYEIPIILKSTVPPDTMEKIYNINGGSKSMFAFCPEFLTEANYLEDFIENDLIIGTNNYNMYNLVVDLFNNSNCKNYNKLLCTPEEASIIKYGRNCYLATKVIFFNQLKKVCKNLNFSEDQYENVRQGISSDDRIGESHTMVPGPDGKLGYGGSCFPKDMSAFYSFCKKNKVDFSLIRESILENLKIRK